MPALGLTSYSGGQTTNKEGGGSAGWGEGGVCAMFTWAVRNSLKEKAAGSEQKLGQGAGKEPCGCLEKALQTEGNATAKVWKQECVWHVQKQQGEYNVAGAVSKEESGRR